MRTKREIVDEIRSDISKGIYIQFPKLKERLSYISTKLFNSIYVVNSEAKLTYNEVKDLSEAGYLDSQDIKEFFDTQ